MKTNALRKHNDITHVECVFVQNCNKFNGLRYYVSTDPHSVFSVLVLRMNKTTVNNDLRNKFFLFPIIYGWQA